MAPLLADENIWKYNIIAIQELWRNQFQTTTYHLVKDRFDLVYNEQPNTRVCFFINSQLRGAWTHTHHTLDLDTLHLQFKNGKEARIVHIHNIYNLVESQNENQPSTLPDLRKALESDREEEHLLIGDFNLHYPMWGGVQSRKTSEEATDLLELITDYHLELLLPVGTKTRQDNGEPSTIDLVFGTWLLSESIISCGLTGNDLDHNSDHLLITTLLSLTTTRHPERKRRLWNQLREKDFQEETINKAIEHHCPESQVCPRSVPGWTPEIKAAQMHARRLHRQFQLLRTKEAWEEYRAARNLKGRLIKKLLRKNHWEQIQEATETQSGLWRLAKWARNRQPRQSFTPPLRVDLGPMKTQTEDKIALLKENFFPQMKEADLSDL
ncbi:conserved hypothetical protein [Talaromyces stipitatus ATCC 10500]|uniref:Endonuclease/exonuclease/phosphatase domain-containing protein n=1 Tax=Talaromyces stipitatus (strain ATCC 10500 / CBS 375.48 / QM 6759 / NRRL 1006) TaxID=441959 RepID=B8MKG4_TALSN|nr:uncharacterized protein TSTA_047650 [Talaromyces stipitatus ATCC 10500]EED15319.1 conserved hypothetical protein [Talaromyces stipitatus ATCC 10500]